MESYELMKIFKGFISSAMYYATQSHKSILKENANLSVALAYLNASISRFASAEALYYAQYSILSHEDAEDLFHQFKLYSNEFLRNVSTNHSHQWTDIEFNKLNDIFKSSVFASENPF